MTSVADRLLVLTIVSVRPYLYEIPHLLALEERATFKFRFRQYWIPEEDRAQLRNFERGHNSQREHIPTSAEQSSGLSIKCLVMYRNQEQGLFFPIRLCTLQTFTVIGEVFYFRVSLGTLPLIEQDPEAQERQFRQLQQTHCSSLGDSFPNVKGQELRKLVFFTSEKYLESFHDKTGAGSATHREFNTWDVLFQRLSRLPEFADVDFFKVIGLFDGNEKKIDLKAPCQYELRAGHTYSVRLYQRRPQSPPSVEGDVPAIPNVGIYPVNLKVDSAVIRPLVDRARVLGRYDILEFIFRPLPTAVGERTHLLIELGFDEGRHPQALRTFPLEAQITAPEGHVAATIVFGIVLISLFFRPLIASAVHLGDDTVANIQMFLLFLLGVGTPAVQRVAQSIMSKSFRI